MSSDRQLFDLDEVYDFRSGLSKPRSAFGRGHPFLTFKDVFYNFFVPKELGDLVESSAAERTNADIKRGDVFLTRTSETQHELGMSCVALSDIPNGTFNGFTKRLRPKPGAKIVPEYAAYYFRSPEFRERITAISTLSTRASLNEAMLAHLQIALPDVATQTSIGTILKSLDDQVSMLREMNRTLEGIVRTLFRAWFVDFEPVRTKAAGATSFRGMPQDVFDSLPADFEGSDAGPIPSGWHTDRLATLVRQPIGRGLAPKYVEAGGIAVLNQRCIRNRDVDFALARQHDHNTKPPKEKTVEQYDILVNSTGVGTLGRVAQVYELPEVATADSHVSLVKPDAQKIAPLVLGFDLTNREQEIERLGHGSTGQTELSRQKLGDLKVVVPDWRSQYAFVSLVTPLVLRKVSNFREIETLTSIRDSLLPKLISGELEAPRLEALGLEAVSHGG